MKKKLVYLILFCFAYGAELSMPPSIPVLSQADVNSSKSSCDMIPPMLHMLPPPLQSELDKCINEKNKPSVEAVKAYLGKNKIKYKEITIEEVKDFARLYQIDLGNKRKFLCNGQVTKCFEVK
jgi:hypothetical protein